MLKEINTFLKNYLKSENYTIVPINNSASERKYFRTYFNNDTYILAYNENIAENETFYYFTKIFSNENLPVPNILEIDSSKKIYLQNDLGDINLLNLLNKEGESIEVNNLYKKSIKELIKLQYSVSKKIDYSLCYDYKKLDKNLIFNDLNYFKFCFFQTLEIPFSNYKLSNEFIQIAEKAASLSPQGFVYRDFQARNIMIKNSHPYFIDYQGGMQGNSIYDLVSLLWQAKAQLSSHIKNELKNYYFELVEKEIKIPKNILEESYQYCVLIRTIQVLGAYGFRGILQKKQHFVDSILFGIQNLKYFIENYQVIESYPEFNRIIQILIEPKTELVIKKIIQ